MKLRVLIVDDEPLALERLAVAFADIEDASIIGKARNGEDAIRIAKELLPDLVMLDIQMPGRSGIEVAQSLRGLEIVFVTAFDSFAATAFDLDAADYLLKPVRTDRLRAAVSRARRRMAARQAGEQIDELQLLLNAQRQKESPSNDTPKFDTEIWAPRPGGVSRIPIQSIVWLEAARDYVLAHTAHRTFILRDTMSGLNARLDPSVMLRAHRSAIVQKRYIEGVERVGRDGLNLVLSTGAVVRLGALYKKAVLEALGVSVPNRNEDGP